MVETVLKKCEDDNEMENGKERKPQRKKGSAMQNQNTKNHKNARQSQRSRRKGCNSAKVAPTVPQEGITRAKSLSEVLDMARSGIEARILCLDTETTGVRDDDRITQFSATMLVLRGERDVRKLLETDIESLVEERYDAFCNPGHRINPKASEVTGLTNEMLRKYPRFADGVLADAQRLVDAADIIVGHNVGFDIKKLRHEGVAIEDIKVVDTMFDFRDMCKYRWGIDRPEKNLTAATKMFGYSFAAHNSANDVDATLFLFSRLAGLGETCSTDVNQIVKEHDTHSKRVQSYINRRQNRQHKAA